MFGIGLPEMIVIAIVALVFIGPKNLPGVLRSVGRGLVQLKRATNEVRTTVQDEMDQIEREIDLKDVREAATDLKKDFDGVKSGLDPLSMNRISSGEQLEAVADVMDEQEKKKSDSEKTSDKAKSAETVADSSSSTAKDTSVSDLSGASKTKEECFSNGCSVVCRLCPAIADALSYFPGNAPTHPRKPCAFGRVVPDRVPSRAGDLHLIQEDRGSAGSGFQEPWSEIHRASLPAFLSEA